MESIKAYDVWREFIKTWKTWYRASEKNLLSLGMSTVEYRILKNLLERGPLPMIELANINMVTQGWVTGVVDKLEKNGFVRRERSSKDRRVINIEELEQRAKKNPMDKSIQEEINQLKKKIDK